jgi:ADP-ribosylglycohydrolase
MLGAIAGDVIGSVYEHRSTGSSEFPLISVASRFTDDTVLTVATAEAILRGTDYESAYRAWASRYPDAGYGGTFRRWVLDTGMGAYGSWGNGSAMRVSPVGWAYDSMETVLQEAAASASVTHDHAEGIRGAQSVALAVFLARTGASKGEIRAEIAGRFGYDLTRTIEEIRPAYLFDVSCQGSVPEAITAFLEASSVEDAVRLAISLGGDADTQAAIAGGIAEAFFGEVPVEIAAPVLERLPAEMREVVDEFNRMYRRG